jgi:hypothetical protein
MKSIIAVALVVVALASHGAYAACGGGGWKKSKTPDTDSAPTHSSSDTAVVTNSQSTTSQSTTVVKTEPAKAVTPAATQIVTSAPIVDATHKPFDTAQFDAVSAKLGLSEDQWKDVQKAKNDIGDQLNKLLKAQRKAEHKYATCDGDCSSEYNKLNRTTEALKTYDPSHEFDRRLAEILQPSQLQTYEADTKEKVSAVKKG